MDQQTTERQAQPETRGVYQMARSYAVPRPRGYDRVWYVYDYGIFAGTFYFRGRFQADGYGKWYIDIPLVGTTKTLRGGADVKDALNRAVELHRAALRQMATR